MRKILKISISIIVATLIAVAFVGCSNDEAKVEAYLESKKEVMSALNDSYESMGMEVECEARGTDVVYTLKMENMEALKDSLDPAMESVEGVYEVTLEQMKAEEPAITGMIYEFCDENGKVIKSYKFK